MIRVLTKDFPLVKPIIQVMAKVSHANIEDNTFNYIGPSLFNWNPNSSSLIIVVKSIHEDFSKNPPIPKSQQA
jgi:hypothetical protein